MREGKEEMEDAYQYHEVNSEQPEQSQNNDEPPKKKSKIKKILTITILVYKRKSCGSCSLSQFLTD